MCLAALEGGGRVRHGAKLDGYYTSRPLLREDRSLFFVRNGRFFLCRGLDVVQTIGIPGADDRSLGTEAVEVGSTVFVAVRLEEPGSEIFRVDVS